MSISVAGVSGRAIVLRGGDVWRLKPSVGRMSSAILKNCLDLTWKVMVRIGKFGATQGRGITEDSL